MGSNALRHPPTPGQFVPTTVVAPMAVATTIVAAGHTAGACNPHTSPPHARGVPAPARSRLPGIGFGTIVVATTAGGLRPPARWGWLVGLFCPAPTDLSFLCPSPARRGRDADLGFPCPRGPKAGHRTDPYGHTWWPCRKKTISPLDIRRAVCYCVELARRLMGRGTR